MEGRPALAEWFSPMPRPRFWIGLFLLAGLGVLAWSSSPSADTHSPSTRGVAWSDPVQVATGEAYMGPWRMNESDWRFVDDPTVALGRKDTAGVVWTDHVEQDLYFQAYAPDRTPLRSSPVNVSRTPDTFSWLPRMVFPTGRPDTVYVLWQEIIFSGGTHGGEAMFARSLNGGRSFQEPINLSQSVAGDGKGRLTQEIWDNGSLDLTVGPEGTIYASWTEYEGRLLLCRSPDTGAHFSAPVHVAGTTIRPARGPSLAVDSTGTLHLAWAVGEDSAADIRYSHSTDPWSALAPPRTVAESEGHSDAPSLAVAPSGTLHLAYGESPSGPFHQYHVRYTRSPPGTDSFTTSTAISDRAQPDRGAHFPTLRVSDRDTLHVLWERYPNRSDRPRGLAYTTSTDGGRTFEAASVVPGSATPEHGFNGSQQGLLMEKLAVNGNGDLAVVNSTFDRGNASHVWLYRGQTGDH